MKVKDLIPVVVGVLVLLALLFTLIQIQAWKNAASNHGEAILNVPFVRQKEWFCSEASASMVLRYYGYNLSQDEINEMGYDRFENMVPLLSRYVEARYRSLTIEDLKREIDEEDPVILRILSGSYLHTIVVVGYSSEYIYIHDPANGSYLRVSSEVLLSVWYPTNFSAIVFEH